MKTILKKVFHASMAILSIMWLIFGITRIFGSGSAFMGILMLINVLLLHYLHLCILQEHG